MAEEKFDLKELDDLERRIGGKKLDYIRFEFSDLNGLSRGVTVPRKQVPSALKNGVSFFAGALSITPRADLVFIKELVDLHLPNCTYLPSPHTLQLLPWAGKRTNAGKTEDNQRTIGQVLCESAWIAPFRGGGRMEACPRYLLRKQLDRLDKLGYVFKSAFEVEFTAYNKSTNKPVFPGVDAGSTLVFSQFEDYLLTLDENLQQIGIDASSIVVEHGEGQFEFALEPSDGIKSADSLFRAKHAIKEISHQFGYQATFMSKPTKDASPNGLHLNVSLWKKYADGTLKNAFHDAADKHGLSLLHRYWIAGLIKHGKSLCAFYCPTYNCYKRIHKFMAPDKIDWGVDDRTAAFRAKSSSHAATYCENRIPSGASNPYLVVAATIIAGLDGIINRLDVQPARTDRIDPATTATVGKRRDSVKDNVFPYSLSEALDELENDDIMRECLGEEFIRWFVQMKREGEIETLDNLSEEEQWQKERELYFEFI
ncbi:hypothetical protein HELRODRAFT_186218 [Helobdella robusta]|uniref:Lengsin n=1 Tax=Helobdella robusta TaxID=6412 RepID=T1FNT9_HELRO|nr:hypothetical protein HELRODRAFT_186218 [Helobdella robusta]ESN90164.1 hypothetical protein HELRODRAFT_186218 [Helobdella robusta]